MKIDKDKLTSSPRHSNAGESLGTHQLHMLTKLIFYCLLTVSTEFFVSTNIVGVGEHTRLSTRSSALSMLCRS